MEATRRTISQSFQIGEIPITITSQLRWQLANYHRLYREFETAEPSPRAIHIDVRRQPLSLRQRRRFEVWANGRLRFQPDRSDAVLPCIEWATNCEIPRLMPQFLQLHASSMQVGDQNVIFPGVSGSGKSTLTAGLLAAGWKYLSDEFALVHSETLHLHPYPRAICIKKPSYPVVASLGLKLEPNQHYFKGSKGHVGFVHPLRVRPGCLGSPGPARWVIFPKYTPDTRPMLIPISKAEAAFALHEVCFNLLNCQTVGLNVLAPLVRQAQCYRLITGEIRETCRLLQELVAKSPTPAAELQPVAQ